MSRWILIKYSTLNIKYNESHIYIYIYIYAIMKTICPPGYHHDGFVTTHALGHMMYDCAWCAQVHELPQIHCGNNQEGTLFSRLNIYYTHFAFVRFEHSVYRGSLMTTIYICIYIYIYIYNICIFYLSIYLSIYLSNLSIYILDLVNMN